MERNFSLYLSKYNRHVHFIQIHDCAYFAKMKREFKILEEAEN